MTVVELIVVVVAVVLVLELARDVTGIYERTQRATSGTAPPGPYRAPPYVPL